MRRLDWFLVAVIGLFLAAAMAWETLAVTAEAHLASRQANVELIPVALVPSGPSPTVQAQCPLPRRA